MISHTHAGNYDRHDRSSDLRKTYSQFTEITAVFNIELSIVSNVRLKQTIAKPREIFNHRKKPINPK